MSPELTAIVTAYEQENLSPEQIASDRDLDITAVKAALMQGSSRYRKDCGKEDSDIPELDFDNEQLQRVNTVIYDLALSAEDEHLRFKAATYVRNDKKGRLEPVKNLAGQNFNILMINQKLAQVRQIGDNIKRTVLGNNQTKELVNV
jgi:hypothetical protein